MDISVIPEYLVDILKDYLWGNFTSHQKKNKANLFNIKETFLAVTFLKPINIQKRDNIIFREINRFFYCPICGEKSLCPYTSFLCCEDCESYIIDEYTN